jgi:hypothetical protein
VHSIIAVEHPTASEAGPCHAQEVDTEGFATAALVDAALLGTGDSGLPLVGVAVVALLPTKALDCMSAQAWLEVHLLEEDVGVQQMRSEAEAWPKDDRSTHSASQLVKEAVLQEA